MYFFYKLLWLIFQRRLTIYQLASASSRAMQNNKGGFIIPKLDVVISETYFFKMK